MWQPIGLRNLIGLRELKVSSESKFYGPARQIEFHLVIPDKPGPFFGPVALPRELNSPWSLLTNSGQNTFETIESDREAKPYLCPDLDTLDRRFQREREMEIAINPTRKRSHGHHNAAHTAASWLCRFKVVLTNTGWDCKGQSEDRHEL